MISAFNLFKATEIIPDRKIILDAFSSMFDVSELKEVLLEIVEEDINVDFKTKPVEDGNVKKNENVNVNKSDNKDDKNKK